MGDQTHQRVGLQLPSLLTTLPAAVQQTPTEVTLQALDAAQAAWPAYLGPVAASTVPVAVSPDTHYVLELRRSRSYDQGLRSPTRPNGDESAASDPDPAAQAPAIPPPPVPPPPATPATEKTAPKAKRKSPR